MVARLVLGLAALSGPACGNTTLDLFNADRGLLAYWNLDEGEAGSPVLDGSGFGLHATPSTNPPGPSRDVPPVHFVDPYSLTFNGQDQWLNVGNPPLLNSGGPVSIAAWARPATLNGYHNLVAHGWRSNPNQEVALRINGGDYQFVFWNTIDHGATASIPSSDAGAWVHLCGVFDGSQYRLYRNGALAATTDDATGPPANIDAPWAIGARAPQPDAVERLFEGQLDEVRIYGRALATAEVEALYRR